MTCVISIVTEGWSGPIRPTPLDIIPPSYNKWTSPIHTMMKTPLFKGIARVMLTASVLSLPTLSSAQFPWADQMLEVRPSQTECRGLVTPGAFSVRQVEGHRAWHKKHPPSQGLQAWILIHGEFHKEQDEARQHHTKLIVACDHFRDQTNVISLNRRRFVVLDPSPNCLPGSLTRTGRGMTDSSIIDRAEQSLGITRPSTRNASSFFSWVEEGGRPTKRSIKKQADEMDRSRMFLRP